ncbi:MAG: hypothetical protein A2020_09950 [Lentisphaerae bacterium GWF2_45_14]|nr:MAG: hypothetical protein A2020_09950 [Lentisphaerae bacterium GWF2_45_14]
MWALVIVFSICCHEFAHAWMALQQGDSTAAEQGHLTLNPLKQMGVFSLIMMAIMGIAWGAVPVNPSRMKHKYSAALVSFAGPLMNLILFLIFLMGFSLASYYLDVRELKENRQLLVNICNIFFIGSTGNILLFLLNLLPLPVLDGWNVFVYIFPRMQKIVTGSEFIKAMYLILIILFITFIDQIMFVCESLIVIVSRLLMILFYYAGL